MTKNEFETEIQKWYSITTDNLNVTHSVKLQYNLLDTKNSVVEEKLMRHYDKLQYGLLNENLKQKTSNNGVKSPHDEILLWSRSVRPGN